MRFRKILFYTLVAVYLVLCPLTILYALGYVLKPGTEHGITRTGVISISTVPPGATVYVGRSRYTEVTPTILHDLLPGSYEITLWLKGHASWIRRVPVESKQATVLERILLLPDPLTSRRLLLTAFDQLIPLPGSPLLVVGDGPRLGDLRVYHWKQQEERLLVASDSPWASARLLNVWTMPKSTVVLARVDTRNGVRMLWFDAKDKPVQFIDLSDLIPDRPDMVMWHAGERYRLFALREGRVSRIDVAKRAVVPNVLDGARALGVIGRSLYVLTEESALFRVDAEGRAKAVGMEEPAFMRALRGLRGSIEIVAATDELMAFRAEGGGLVVSRPPYRLTEQGIRGVQWSEDHDLALCWQRDRIGLIEPAQELVPGTTATAQEGDQDAVLRARRVLGGFDIAGFDSPETPAGLTWIYANGHAIEQVFWAYHDAYILFRDDDQVFLLERPLVGAPRPIPMVRIHRHTEIAYNDEAGTLYYLDPEGWLSSLQVVPRWELLPLSSLRSFDAHAEAHTDELPRGTP